MRLLSWGKEGTLNVVGVQQHHYHLLWCVTRRLLPWTVSELAHMCPPDQSAPRTDALKIGTRESRAFHVFASPATKSLCHRTARSRVDRVRVAPRKTRSHGYSGALFQNVCVQPHGSSRTQGLATEIYARCVADPVPRSSRKRWWKSRGKARG